GGVAGAAIVNCTEPLVPLSVVTVTSCAPKAASGGTLNVAVSAVSLFGLTFATVIPAPLTKTVVPFKRQAASAPAPTLPKNPLPVKVTAIEAPRTPVAGEIAVSVGGGLSTFKVIFQIRFPF